MAILCRMEHPLGLPATMTSRCHGRSNVLGGESRSTYPLAMLNAFRVAAMGFSNNILAGRSPSIIDLGQPEEILLDLRVGENAGR